MLTWFTDAAECMCSMTHCLHDKVEAHTTEISWMETLLSSQFCDWRRPSRSKCLTPTYSLLHDCSTSPFTLPMSLHSILCALRFDWCCYAGVNCAPTVTLMTSLINPVNTGMNVTMQCLAKNPTGSGLTYVWLHNGFQIHQALSPTLMLIGVTPKDRGTYVCRVTNRVGQGFASTFLDVIGKVFHVCVWMSSCVWDRVGGFGLFMNKYCYDIDYCHHACMAQIPTWILAFYVTLTCLPCVLTVLLKLNILLKTKLSLQVWKHTYLQPLWKLTPALDHYIFPP